MEIITGPMKEIVGEAKTHINLRIAQLALSISRSFARLNATVLVALIMLGLAGIIILMLTFAFVFWYGAKVGTYYHGFLIAALFYLLTGLFIYLFRQKLFIDPAIRSILALINEDMAVDGLIPRVHNTKELEQQLELISLKIKQSEHQMETKFAELSERLNPANLLKEAVGGLLSSSAVIISLIDMILSLLRRRRHE